MRRLGAALVRTTGTACVQGGCSISCPPHPSRSTPCVACAFNHRTVAPPHHLRPRPCLRLSGALSNRGEMPKSALIQCCRVHEGSCDVPTVLGLLRRSFEGARHPSGEDEC